LETKILSSGRRFRVMTLPPPFSPRLSLLIVLIAALIAAPFYVTTLKAPAVTTGDTPQYVSAAWHMAHHGVFSEATSSAPPAPSLGREPAYALFLVPFLILDPALAGFTPDCLADGTCADGPFRLVQAANVVLAGVAALLLVITVRLLGGGPTAATVAGLYLVANAEMMASRHSVASDYLALALVAGAGALLAAAVRSGRPTAFVPLGLVMAALTLTKAVFLPFTVLALGAGALWALWQRVPVRTVMAAGIVFACAFAAPVGGWMARNAAVGGSFAITVERGGIAISTREVFNHMSGAQYVAAFVYWTRGFGDGLARDLFDRPVWERFRIDVVGGFYDEGQNRYGPWVEQVMAERGVERGEARRIVDQTLIRHILDRPFTHALTTLPLLYRGLWIDEFIVFGLPALLWAGIMAWRQRRGALLAGLGLSAFNLTLYALVSLNIPRYQITAVPGIALAAGFAAAALWPAVTGWRDGRRKRRVGAVTPKTVLYQRA